MHSSDRYENSGGFLPQAYNVVLSPYDGTESHCSTISLIYGKWQSMAKRHELGNSPKLQRLNPHVLYFT
jgi:hypothetical protein